MSDSFWLNQPAILLNKDKLFQLLPSSRNTTNENLNAITRLIIIISLFGYALSQSPKILMSLFVSLIVILFYYKYKSNNDVVKKMEIMKEGFSNPEFYNVIKNEFTNPTNENPMMNVMLPEINKKPIRKSAAPSFTKPVETEINKKVKEGLDPRLFKDLGDNIVFENSMRNFYTMPNTDIVNDQKSFAEFCYGNMPSCKEGDGIACDKKNYRHTSP
jgi:hypothetical protein